MVAKCLPLLLACAAAGALLLVHAKVHRRCTEVTWGVKSGLLSVNDPVKLPSGLRRHTLDLPSASVGCVSRGIVLTVCDLVPPEVDLADDGASARVLRLGPLWLEPMVEQVTYCAPLVPSTTPGSVKLY